MATARTGRLLRAQHVQRRGGTRRTPVRRLATLAAQRPHNQGRGQRRPAVRRVDLLELPRRLLAPADGSASVPLAAATNTHSASSAPQAAVAGLLAVLGSWKRQGKRPAAGTLTTRVAMVAIGLSVVVLVASRAFPASSSGFALPDLPSQAVAFLLYDELVSGSWPVSASSGGHGDSDGQPLLVRYLVTDGDTLGGIAARFELSLDTIISFNSIRNARSLPVGMALILPRTSGLRYDVGRGDTLSDIASTFGVGLNELVDVNELDSAVIVPGQTLVIPGANLDEDSLNKVLGRYFVAPTLGRLSSRYGFRNDPFTGIRRFHNGIDVAGAEGTKIGAAMRGTVALVGYNGNYGRYAILRHADGYQTLYAHLHDVSVARGQSVRQGQKIGEMGNTGYSSGSHLHFSLFQNGEHVDPLPHLDYGR
jgi:murein DD-endopeptidase MepM/ murein hydrolase activator NlpD